MLPSIILGTLVPALFVVGAPTKDGIVKRADTWGGALSLGPTTSNIIKASTTIIPGAAPATQNGELFLWPGMSNGTGNLIQTTLESWPDNSWCGAVSGQWCIRASLFGLFPETPLQQIDGPDAAVSGTDKVLIVYERGPQLDTYSWNWTQTVTNADTGKYLSSLTHASGPMTGYGTGTECDDQCTGTIAAQTYKNTQIVLASSDTNFGKTLGVSGGTTYSGLSVSSDGKTWTISEINIPKM
ncbi:hypothetical protein PVAG01_04531 [Phlyctema vagabunda]|uniref:Uncharacterized protein n=1 Tax=Phlyctema vagabunda TaxID=108571 RepID=A0ABR4PHJ9_9HELO